MAWWLSAMKNTSLMAVQPVVMVAVAVVLFFVADSGLRTLMDFRYRRKFKADSGENGPY